MNKIIHTKTSKLLAVALPAFAILLYSGVAFADSVKYSTPYSENATGYKLDGDVTVNVNVAEINALEMTLSIAVSHSATALVMNMGSGGLLMPEII